MPVELRHGACLLNSLIILNYFTNKLKFYEKKENMLPHPLESIATQRREAALEAAELHRLLKAIRKEQTKQQSVIWQVRHWLGDRLVAWGCQLQGRRMTTLPQLLDREPCCG